jgi:REP element-mobilizing transposase RayT
VFVVQGYIVMPEHIHLLLSEPQVRTISVVMQALKLGFARRVLNSLANGSHFHQGLQDSNASHFSQEREN